MNCTLSDDETLIPLPEARKTLLPRDLNPSTTFRWIKRGLAPATPDGERIYLPVTYVGRTPHISRRALREFLDAVTAARLTRLRAADHASDVTESELAAAGLI
jgi:hypothetical protein